MKPLTYILPLMCIALTACDSGAPLIAPGQPSHVQPKRAINFNMQEDNLTRSITEAMRTEHYEFGVWTSLHGAYTTDSCENVMQNYLVAYTGNDVYQAWQSDKASWLYTSLGSNDTIVPPAITAAPYTKSAHDIQRLSYWEEDKGTYYFYAYAPYMNEDDSQPGTIAIGSTADGEYLQFNGLRAFYTSPANGGAASPNITSYQTGRVEGMQTATGYHAAESFADSDAEIINANEALYAGQAMSPETYALDVPIIFKHVNAKVRVAFWSDIKGYDVKLLDLVPEDISITYGTGQPTVKGVVFTPATLAMTDITKPQTPKAQLAPYYNNACVRVEGIEPLSAEGRTNFKNIIVGNPQRDAVSRENLYFAVPPEGTLIAKVRDKATFLPTVYYPLPNYESTLAQPDYVTAEVDGNKVASTTGFTVHASFAMIPADGSPTLKVYDSRVHVPAADCRWEPGKFYTYVFHITDKANGTTDPNLPDPGDPSTPWVDPDDPRVPDSSLKAIVFDGVKVEDYIQGGELEKEM